MAKKKTKSKTAAEVPFEKSLEQLRAVVAELENGNLTLGESLEKYEQGIANLKSCYEALNQAQRRIELLVDLDEDGNLVTRSFDDTASAQMTDGVRRSARTQQAANELDNEDGEDEDPYEEDDMDDPNSLF